MFAPDIAEASEEMEQAVVAYEEAALMYRQCQQDTLKLKERMQRARHPARQIPRSHDELVRFPGLRVAAANFSE